MSEREAKHWESGNGWSAHIMAWYLSRDDGCCRMPAHRWRRGRSQARQTLRQPNLAHAHRHFVIWAPDMGV